MAKRAQRKADVNKTQAIKDQLAGNPGATPKAISAELAKQGIDANPQYVSAIKSKLKKSRGGRRRKGAARGGKKAASDSISLSALVETKKFAEKMGGVGRLKAAIDALAKLE